MVKLTIEPDQEGFAVTFPQDVIVSEFEGGPPRQRRNFIGGYYIVNVQWTLNQTQYDDLLTFYRTTANRGVTPFEIDLPIENAVPEEHTALFINNSFSISSVTGNTVIVTATLSVKPRTV